MSVWEIIYSLAALMLAVYAFNYLLLTALYFRHRGDGPDSPPLETYPFVTVQLPVFNEAFVIERLIKAAVELDWPADRLQIQVLDDSTDDTTSIARHLVARYVQEGVDIELVHRVERPGFKAGALKGGMMSAKGEFIAIFDADFVPPRGFLVDTVPHFVDRPRLGMIQTRWGHLNADYSLLTLAQSLALDGHFVVEQFSRQRSGMFMNFNGTAGVWRRECIEGAGGWHGDTISEDLDLSYRAQLGGWEFLLLPEVESPAEIPPQLAAFKRQQFRWAKGSIQCLKKLLFRVVTARVPWKARLEAAVHLSTYLSQPLMLLLIITTLPLMLSHRPLHLPLAYVSVFSLGPPLMYAVAQHALHGRGWLARYKYMPVLIMLGTGIALNNSRAVFEGMLGVGNVFRRTPKFKIEGREGQWRGSRYALPLGGMVIGEGVLAVYSLLTVLVAWQQGNYYAIPFILMYASGFCYVASLGVWESREDLLYRLRRLLRLPVSPGEKINAQASPHLSRGD